MAQLIEFMTVIHQAYHDLFGRWERAELTDQQLIEASLVIMHGCESEFQRRFDAGESLASMGFNLDEGSIDRERGL